MRFHALPDSRRYAASEDEYAEILRRHGAVGAALFIEGAPLYLYRAHLAEPRLRGRQKHQIAGRQFRENLVVLPPEGAGQDGDGDRMYVRALATHWKPDFFEAAIRLIADWQEVGITFACPATKNIFCPYDGGMDVFTFSIAPEELRARFAGWRSTHPDGL